MAAREALLKTEYREWYPTLTPGVWYDATRVAVLVLEQLKAGEPRWAFEGRVPSEEHFQFRGGRARAPGEAYSRRTDPA